MLELVRHEVFADDERLKITDFEQRLPQPTQTHQTARVLEAAYPADDFWFVYGADAYHAMLTWERGAELRQRLGMLLVARSGFELPVETARLRHLALAEATDGLSSTEFRRTRQAGGAAAGLVCEAVERYIQTQSLYTAGRIVTL
jgi:nicotinate-nucleotide adenylyltransferase